MNITIDHIKHIAKYETLYLVKGSDLYRKDHVHRAMVEIDDNDVVGVTCYVKDMENTLYPSISIADGEIIKHECTCFEYQQQHTCRHIIALLYKYMYELYDQEVARLIDQDSDPITMEMIENYLSLNINQFSNDSQQIELQPTLTLHEKETSISFQVGKEKKYVVKDIDQFLTQVYNDETVSYGKGLTFHHNIHNFTQLSQQLIRFLIQRRNEINNILNRSRNPHYSVSMPRYGSSYYDTSYHSYSTASYSSYGSYTMKKNMDLTPSMLDELFSLYLNEIIQVKQADDSVELFLVSDVDPQLQATLLERGSSQYIMKMTTPYKKILGASYNYMIRGNTIHRLSKQFNQATSYFLHTMASNKNTLVLHRKHMNAFYNSVISYIKPYINIDIQTDLSEYQPAPVITRLYFDAYNEGVSTEIRFVYDDMEYQYGPNYDYPHRNITDELKMVALVSKYFDKETDDGLYVLDQEDKLYDFVSTGLDDLAKYCELYYSEDFKNIRIKPSPSISAGVRLSEGLLHLNFDIQDFDIKELKQLLSAYRQKKKYYRSKDGSFMHLDQGGLSSIQELMDSFHLSEKDILKKEIAIPKYRAMQMDAFIKQNEQIKFERDRSFKQLIRDFSSVSDSDFAIDSDLKPILRNYQKSGYRWLKTMAAYQFGGILADDMGLGKTLQVIALLKNAKSEFEDQSAATQTMTQGANQMSGNIASHNIVNHDAMNQSIVVSENDTAITENNNEVNINVKFENGNAANDTVMNEEVGLGVVVKQPLHPISIVITPASLVLNWQKEIEKFAPGLRVLVVIGGAKQRAELISTISSFDVIVTSYDLLKRDVELYKNMTFTYQIIDEAQYIKNHTTLAAKTVKEINSVQRFALSGTPVENSLAELWSIFDYLMPNYLFPYHYFKEHYETPIVKEEDKDTLHKLRKMVQPFILRRLKKDVLKELPEKMEATMYCQLEGEQQKLYIANAMSMSRDLKEKLDSEGINQNKLIVLALLTKLRQLCCHPKLCYDNYEGQSSKLDMCMELVQNSIDGNHQVLIFSSFTSMLDLIKPRLEAAGISYFELTGSTSTFKRMELVNEFQAGAVPVFLISLKAGGTGLNLTAADVVIHFDPWWNISAQNQATDRTHRIGQTSNVNVYNLIAKDTIEEKILNLQEKKRNLADAIVEEGGNLISTMTKEDIMSLFEVK